jgi:hypothetical protein
VLVYTEIPIAFWGHSFICLFVSLCLSLMSECGISYYHLCHVTEVVMEGGRILRRTRLTVSFVEIRTGGKWRDLETGRLWDGPSG